MHVLIAGNGKMAQLFETRLPEDGHTSQRFIGASTTLETLTAPVWETVALHVGSGRQLPELVNFCSKIGIPILQGSTTPESQPKPDWPGCMIVNAPNFALPILRLIQALPDFARKINPKDYPLGYGIVESHQSTKKSVPGTAVRMAEAVGLDAADIISVRHQSAQTALGIPPSALDAHGYHWITWSGAGVQIQLTTKVNGRDAYYAGGQYLLGMLDARRQESGVRDVIEFLGW